MNSFSKKIQSAVTVILALVSLASLACAAGPKFKDGGNKHNLSSSNTGVTYQALVDVSGDPRSTQVCVFCHTPHGANIEGQAPLWNRKFSTETFQRYSSDTLQIRSISAANYGEPNGSSKLCLSCHDGVSRLGALYTGAEITMVGGGTLDVISGLASFKPDTNKMKSGHHPVSFVYDATVLSAIQSYVPKAAYTLSSLPQYVKMDKQGRMQCSTCHDPHQNQSSDTECYALVGGANVPCDTTNTRKITPFWVYGVNGTAGADQQDVCLSCHPMAEWTGFSIPWTPNP